MEVTNLKSIYEAYVTRYFYGNVKQKMLAVLGKPESEECEIVVSLIRQIGELETQIIETVDASVPFTDIK